MNIPSSYLQNNQQLIVQILLPFSLTIYQIHIPLQYQLEIITKQYVQNQHHIYYEVHYQIKMNSNKMYIKYKIILI
jgi:hypothetical protein